ncbi:MAG: ArsR/SmtB family transcription factor [bacterium]
MNDELWLQAEKVSDILCVLANPVRLVMVCLLLKRERCATELLDLVGTTKGNISQHLKLLLLKNLIRRRRDGHRIYYSIADVHLKTVIQCLNDCYCRGHEDILN